MVDVSNLINQLEFHSFFERKIGETFFLKGGN